MSTFKERLLNEKKELDEKAIKLEDFINGEQFSKIDPVQMSLLNIQLQSMAAYS